MVDKIRNFLDWLSVGGPLAVPWKFWKKLIEAHCATLSTKPCSPNKLPERNQRSRDSLTSKKVESLRKHHRSANRQPQLRGQSYH